MTLKILKLCYEYPPMGGGGSRVVQGLSQELVRLGYSIDLVTMGYKGLLPREHQGDFFIRRVPCIRTNPIVCHSPEMLSYLLMAFPIALKMITIKKYDIIHAHFIFPDGVLAYLLSKVSGLPYLITAHGSDVPGYNPDRFILLHKMLLPVWKSIVRSSGRIICLSRFLESLLKNKLPTANTTIIPNGFNIGRFTPDKQKADRILISSRIFKRKGIQYFLKSVEGLSSDFEIHIAGDGPYLEKLKQQAARMSSVVHFHGYLENTSEKFKNLMETSKIFVLPSISENFSISLLEAMACGMAIITTRGTGCEEVVGDAAILVRPGDVEGLRKALQTYVKDPFICRYFGEKARKRLEENFSWEIVAKKYISIYEEIKQA